MKTIELEFDEPTHTYRWGGEVVPSVGQIIKDAGLVKFSPYVAKYLPEAARRGRLVHTCCEMVDIGREYEVEDAHRGYVESYKAFCEVYSPSWMMTEAMVTQEFPGFNLRVAGRLDRFGTVNDPERGRMEVVADLKTSASVYPHYGIQVAGYNLLLDEVFGVGTSYDRTRCVIKLQKDGKIAKVKYFWSDNDHEIFSSCVKIYAFRKKHRLLEVN